MSTGAPDRNLVSFAGDGLGNIWRDNVLLFSADVPGMREVDVGDLVHSDPGIADTLKLSGCVRLAVTAGVVAGGYEDCLDINHSQECEVRIAHAIPQGKYMHTCKGGSSHILVSVGTLTGHGTETDFDVGNWSDQNPTAKTTDTTFIVGASDGPVQLRVLHGERNSTGGAAQWERHTTWNGLFNPCFRCLKALHLA